MNTEKELKIIGERLLKARIKKKESPRTVAKAVKTSHTNILNAEAGKNMTLCTLYKLSRYYGIKFIIN